MKGTITTKEGLLWLGGKPLGVGEADNVAQENGYVYAERMVHALENPDSIEGFTQMSRRRIVASRKYQLKFGCTYIDCIFARRQIGCWKRISVKLWTKLIERSVPWDKKGVILEKETGRPSGVTSVWNTISRETRYVSMKTTISREPAAQAKLDRLFVNLMAAERRVDYWRQKIAKFGQTDRIKINGK